MTKPDATLIAASPDRLLPPGSAIGILGAGQLGRMLALAAARLGLRTHIYADATGPASDVAPVATVGTFEDLDALAAFASTVDVVTYEFENVPVAAVEHVARHVPVRPGARALQVAQDRLVEKSFIAGLAIPVAPFVPVDTAEAAAAALEQMAVPCILKTRRLGYDGKGQVALAAGDDAAAAFASIGSVPAVLERRLTFAREVSVLAVRGPDGALVCYDCPENTHRGGILRRSVLPAALTEAEEKRARDIARTIAEALDYVGVLAVELFHVPDAANGATLVVNEIAPRVHNSGHWTMDACAVGQFENHIRAVAGWPLAATTRHSDVEMINLIGREIEVWPGLATEAGVCLHLYGKNEAREGRKMGHYNRLLGPARIV